MGRLCAFLSESPNPVAELAATTALYAPQWPGIKCPRTIFHITVRCRRRRLTWLGCGGQRRGGEASGRARTVLGRSGSGRGLCTWRAPSSPRHACGLNGSQFLHTCSHPPAAPAGLLLSEQGLRKPYKTLHTPLLSRAAKSSILRPFFQVTHGKQVI
jgi:hypothetical protein